MMPIIPQAALPTGIKRSVPAPVGGWNARDPIAAMPPTDAVFLDNLWPEPGGVSLRPGSAEWASLPAGLTPAATRAKALLSYSSPSGTKKLFAGYSDGIYDVSAGGTIGAASSACTDGDWHSINFTTPGGSFLWTCNGTDKARIFDGAAWTVLDGTSTPALTGITSTDVANVSVFKYFVILCIKNSLSFFYLPINSIAGAASEFPMGGLFKKGGHLVATDTWTLDGGNGPEDYFVALTSEGELAVYAGTNPSTAATFGIVGVYDIGRPLSRRCFSRLGGDLVVATARGCLPLSKALQSATIDRSIAVSDKISKAWTSRVADYGSLPGWSLTTFPDAVMLLANIPLLQDLSGAGFIYSEQFAMNTQTKAWCRFTGMNAEAWAVHDGELYFACKNKVYKAWTGTDDNGAAIDGKGKTAFSYPVRGGSAFVTLARPLVTTSANIKFQLGIDADFREGAFNASTISYGQQLALWNQALWNQAYWSAGTKTAASWQSVANRPGGAISVRLRVRGKGITMTWNATDLIFQRGGLL